MIEAVAQTTYSDLQGHSVPPSGLLPGLPIGQRARESNNVVHTENPGRAWGRDRWRVGPRG